MKYNKGSIIMMGKSILSLFCLFAALFQINAQDGQVNKVDREKIKVVVENELERRKEVIAKAESYLAEGISKVDEKQFEDAEKFFKKAEETYKSITGPYVELQLKKLKKQREVLLTKWAVSYTDKAKVAYNEKDYKNAAEYARSAIAKDPDLGPDWTKFVQKCEKFMAAEVFKNETTLEKVDPGNKERKDNIDLLLKQSDVLRKNNKFMEARDDLEKVLILDPYNMKATVMLEKVYRKISWIAEQRSENEILERNAEVKWKWNQPILPTDHVIKKDIGTNLSTARKTGLYEKLREIIFDSIDFDDAQITSVVNYLSAESKKLDTKDGTGVNLMLKLDSSQVEKVPRITMSFDKMPMEAILKYLCQAAGLKYSVKEHVVIIGKNIGEMERRFFKARAALIAEIDPSAAEDASAEDVNIEDINIEGFGDQSKTDEGSSKIAAASNQIKSYFVDRGVPFPDGSTIAYDKRAGKLIAKNTPENLRKLEALLRDLDIQTPLVLVECKILEILQNDLDELGFTWTFQDIDAGELTKSGTAKGNPNWKVAATDALLGRGVTAGSNLFTSTILPNFGSNNDMSLSLAVNALEQSGRTEVLSAPKVIATSGNEALVRMVRQTYYPESWTTPEITIGTNLVQFTPSHPEFGEPTNVGINLTVTPTVSPNNYTITLDINPKIISFVQFTKYNYPVIVGTTNSTFTVKMPELSHRDLNVKMKVYDGETVVLGGMIKEESTIIDDKYPVLGDIPLVGRLFKNHRETLAKRNLLIFVTARLVNGDGVPVRPIKDKGIPEFHR